MGEQNSNNFDPGHGSGRASSGVSEKMATAAFVCALIAVISFQIFFIALPLAAVSIILALVSRGAGRLNRRAFIALVTGFIAAGLSIAVTGYAIHTIYSNPEYRRQLEDIYNYYLTPDSDNSLSESEDPQALIKNILSGNYRNQTQENTPDASSVSSEDTGVKPGMEAGPSQSGGSFI